MPIFSYYMSPNKFLQIKRWRLIGNIKTNPADTSLKEDLSVDTTFDPSYISWDTPFKLYFSYLQTCYVFRVGPDANIPNMGPEVKKYM